MTHLSFNTTVCHATSPSIIPTAPTVCLPTRKSVALSVHHTASPSVIPAHPSYEQSIHPPITLSMTRQSATPPISPANHPSDHPSPSDHLYTILPCPSGCPTSSDHTSTINTSLPDRLSLSNHLHTILPCPSDHPPLSHHLYDAPISPSACPSPADCLTVTTTCPPVCTSSPTIHRTQDSSQSLAVVNGEQSRKAKKFHRVFTNYDLLLHALDASSIYLCDLSRVAPPKSGEDAHVHMASVILVELP